MYIGNPFSILGVPDGSDIGICRKAYRKLSKMYHPDEPTGDREKFDEVAKAYNAIEKKQYLARGVLHKKKKLTHDSLFSYSAV